MNGKEVLYVRSSKKKNKVNDDTSTTDEDNDVWDDTILIEAYDKAVQIAQNEVLKKMQNTDKEKEKCNKSAKKKLQWNVGDKCRCEYSEDHNYYEADVIDIIDDVGMCIVKYVGYENEEKVPLSKLRQSKGESARTLQINQAMQENNGVGDFLETKGTNPKGNSKFRQKKLHNTKGTMKSQAKEGEYSQARNSYFTSYIPRPSSIEMSIPPPPPPHMFGNISDDICESEAMSSMLMSWYMSGYHTGFYQGLKTRKK